MTRSSRRSSAGKRPGGARTRASRPRRRDRTEAEIDRRVAKGAEPESFLCLDCYCWSLDPALCGCWTRAVFIVG